MSKKNKKKRSKRAKAKVQLLKPARLAPGSYLVPVVVKAPLPPEVSTWQAFKDWLDSFMN